MTPSNAAHDPNVLLALDNQFCFALHRAARLVVRAYRPVLHGLDLTYSQYLVLLVLWEWERSDEPQPTVHALGERLDLDSGTLTPLLKRLQAKGLITRRRSKADERALHVRLTPAGSAMKGVACQVPLSLLERSSLKPGEILGLRDQLKRVSADLALDAER